MGRIVNGLMAKLTVSTIIIFVGHFLLILISCLGPSWRWGGKGTCRLANTILGINRDKLTKISTGVLMQLILLYSTLSETKTALSLLFSSLSTPPTF